MKRANKLTQLEGPQRVDEFGENGEFGKSGDSDEISPRMLKKYNLHQNRQNRQIRQHVRPISVDVICIKVVRLTGEILSNLPFSSLPAFLE